MAHTGYEDWRVQLGAAECRVASRAPIANHKSALRIWAPRSGEMWFRSLHLGSSSSVDQTRTLASAPADTATCVMNPPRSGEMWGECGESGGGMRRCGEI